MSVDRPQLQAALQTLKQYDAVRVTFVLDGKGALVAWAGKAPGFSPTGQFSEIAATDPETDLFLTIIGPYFVGLLFDGGSDIDTVRASYEVHQSDVAAALNVTLHA